MTSTAFAGNIPTEQELINSSKSIDAILKSEKKISIEDAMKLAELKVTSDPLYTDKLKELRKIQEENIEKYGEPKRKVDEQGHVYYVYPYGEANYNLTQQIIDLENELKDSIKSARNITKNLYFDIVDMKQNVEISKGKLSIFETELQKVKLKYNLGSGVVAEVSSKEANVATAKANYESNKLQLNSLYAKFENATQVSIKYGFKVDSITFDISSLLRSTSENIVTSYVVPSNLDKKAMDRYTSLADLKKELSDKEEALKKSTEDYNEDSIYYYNKSEELGIRVLKDQIADAERNLKLDFLGDSEKLTNEIESFQNVYAKLHLEVKKYELDVIKYKNGQITKSDFLKSKLNYDEQKLQYDNSLKVLYIAVDNYNDKYNLEKGE